MFQIPTKAARLIEGIMRRILWEGSGEGRKILLIGWDMTCRQKEGGVSFISIAKQNRALGAKLVWKVCQEPDKLWTKNVMKEILRCGFFVPYASHCQSERRIYHMEIHV